MDTLSIYEISEETIYIWNCPDCNYDNEQNEDPNYSEVIECEYCNTKFKLIDKE